MAGSRASISGINYFFLDGWKLMSPRRGAHVNSAGEVRSRNQAGSTRAREGGRRNIESRVIGPTRLNAPSMRLMPDHGALIALCKS